jgi:hypothetical protein
MVALGMRRALTAALPAAARAVNGAVGSRIVQMA